MGEPPTIVLNSVATRHVTLTTAVTIASDGSETLVGILLHVLGRTPLYRVLTAKGSVHGVHTDKELAFADLDGLARRTAERSRK
jgi:hypothetical protein